MEEEQQQEQQQQKKPIKKGQTLKGIIWLIIIIAIIVAVAGSCSKDDDTETAQVNDYTKFSEDYKAEYYTCAEDVIDEYINAELPSIGSSDFVFADFDSEDDGKVVITAPLAVSGMMDKPTAYIVISIQGDENGQAESYKCYYFAVGSKLYIDDGSCDETMGKLGLPTKEG